MNVLFLGSDVLALPVLDALLARTEVEVVGVVTQPDRPRGRGRKAAPCALRAHAQAAGLRCIAPERLGEDAVRGTLESWKPDLAVVFAYGQRIPSSLLRLPALGMVNLHPSLLPAYRGAAPIQRALAAGDPETGITLMVMAAAMDAGDILFQERERIAPEDTAITLAARLVQRGVGLVERLLDLLAAGKPPPAVPQRHEKATLAPKLKKEEGPLNWTLPARVLHNRVRAFQPWPLCSCEVPAGSGVRMNLWRTRVTDAAPGAAPGTVLEAKRRWVVAAGEQALELLDVQPPGRARMTAQAYLNGHPLTVGTLLG